MGKFSGPWTARGLAFLAALFSLSRQWAFSLSHNSLMDEGEYLLKGHLFVTGQYTPFQDFGLWTNHMPLSFLIPGWVQSIFGTGLMTGRLYAMVLNLLILVGLWLVARRLSNAWIAAGVLFLFSLNTAVLRIFSTATSQVLITCMLVWVLFFILGPGRSERQVAAGSILAGVMLLTRLNMAPALPIILLYIFWQHGRRSGWIAAAAMGATIIGGHLLYWPGILRMWAAWLPPSLTPFLNEFRPPAGAPAWDPTTSPGSRALSFWFAIRYHFLPLLALLAAGLYWPASDDKGRKKTVIFLAALFFALLAAHAWASLGSHAQTDDALGSDYCIFCFPIYTAFFSILGWLLLSALLATIPARRKFSDWIAPFLLVLISAGAGYGAFKEFGEVLTHLRVPRLGTFFRTGNWEPGLPIWDVLFTRYDIEIEASRRLLAATAGLLVGLLVLWLVYQVFKRRPSGLTFGQMGLMGFLAVGVILTPSPFLGGGYQDYSCPGNVIQAFEDAGAHLRELIPPGAQVYWEGTLSSAPLVYLDSPILLPGQINQLYTLRLSGSEEEHRWFGFWTESMALDWLAASDYALVAGRNFDGWLAEALEDGTSFHELEPTPPLEPCDPGTQLRVFERVEGS